MLFQKRNIGKQTFHYFVSSLDFTMLYLNLWSFVAYIRPVNDITIV